jgi:hypothetical protein
VNAKEFGFLFLGCLSVVIICADQGAARSKARTVFASSNSGMVGSNPTQGMDVCVCVYSAFVLSCV